ncbi:MAG TPA: tyrosine-type recombinase/integrase [Ktedonobacteraceae bacterium]|nr:tyrosine-type recombinase/integrase [Ktedonobacteraceae bacterium]
MNIQKALQDFITAHEVDNDSPHTIRNYRKDLELFLSWLQSAHKVVDTDDLQLVHLRGWVSYLQKNPSKHSEKLSDTTIRQYAVHLQVFCRWLEHEAIIEKPITTRFKLPKVEQKFIPTFTPEEVKKLLDVCDEGSRNRPRIHKALSARNRAIVSMLIDTGIRRQELVNLRLCDVDRELRLLTIHRKGNKWQQVPISREGFKPLHEYLTKYRPQLARVAGKTVARKEDAVFLADDGEQLTIGGVSRLFIRLQRRSGIQGKRVSPHNCRRYMATTQLAMGRSPLDVQRQMGHTTLQMTNRYASLTIEQLQRSHEEYSPLRAKQTFDDKGSAGTGYWDE